MTGAHGGRSASQHSCLQVALECRFLGAQDVSWPPRTRLITQTSQPLQSILPLAQRRCHCLQRMPAANRDEALPTTLWKRGWLSRSLSKAQPGTATPRPVLQLAPSCPPHTRWMGQRKGPARDHAARRLQDSNPGSASHTRALASVPCGGQQSFAGLAKDRAQDRVLDGSRAGPKNLAAPVCECKPAPSSLIASWEPTYPTSDNPALTTPICHPGQHRTAAGTCGTLSWRAPSAVAGMEHAPDGGAGSGGPAQDDARGGAPEATGEVRTPGEKQLSSHTRGPFPLH